MSGGRSIPLRMKMSLSLRLLWAFHGEVIHIQVTEASKSGLLPEQVTFAVLVDELRKVPSSANKNELCTLRCLGWRRSCASLPSSWCTC